MDRIEVVIYNRAAAGPGAQGSRPKALGPGLGARRAVSYPTIDIDTINLFLYIIYLQRARSHAIMPISVYNMYTKFKNIEFSLISYRITIQIFE